MTTISPDLPRTVVVCDDQRELRAAMTLLLGHFDRFAVAGQAIDATSCLQALDETGPDILITDVNMPGGGADFLRSARAQCPDLHIVVYSGRDEAAVMQDMLAAGADVYVVKTGRLRPLIDALDLGHAPDQGAAPELGTARAATSDGGRVEVRGRSS